MHNDVEYFRLPKDADDLREVVNVLIGWKRKHLKEPVEGVEGELADAIDQLTVISLAYVGMSLRPA